jgi:hypothetical protein
VGVVSDNLGLMADEPILTPEAEARARRQAAIRLTGAALTITRGDAEAAAAILRGPLEAIGALPYEAAPGKHHHGQTG